MTVGDGATGCGYMSQIAAELEKAAKALTGISMVDLVRRKHNIGMGPTGPGPKTLRESFANCSRELLQDLRWKVDEGNVNLRAAMRDFQESDASSQKGFGRGCEQHRAGEQGGPWDHKKQKEENLRPHSNGNV